MLQHNISFEKKTQLKFKSREISFLYYSMLSSQIVLNFAQSTAVSQNKSLKRLANVTDVLDKLNFTRFEFLGGYCNSPWLRDLFIEWFMRL